MPLDHAVETVRGILISRLDDLAASWVDSEREKHGLTAAAWLDVFQSLQLALFPEEFGDAPEYQPDAGGRMDVPPPQGLVPRRPQVAIYARHLLEKGRESPAAALTMETTDKNGDRVTVPVFSDADLVVLAQRQEGRERGRAMAV